MSNKNEIDSLVEALKKLNLIPKTGYGELKLSFQKGKIVFTDLTTKTLVNIEIKEDKDA